MKIEIIKQNPIKFGRLYPGDIFTILPQNDNIYIKIDSINGNVDNNPNKVDYNAVHLKSGIPCNFSCINEVFVCNGKCVVEQE